ncbi:MULTISPECIES: hypothetical protein [unclassified Oleiphilus]|uniref:hypothetical protein n=1 Tax=unclassified Oleiphilus TaxID=2631174 RepID=UPI0007C2AAA6|nr:MULTISPECIES: hypothetical protein [unclassified Oleiphilus]KZY37732.1 hypothetical protein A3729_16415 [Oleiphilus sp. HI0043]KZZ67913.1 hypothetical protein A3763_15260 [Oleiphilus sp. HI0128]KZZ72137.1 hypothetical protein A3763_24440 [Oleiphilus sp. HI0128]
MPITEDEYEIITDELDSGEFFDICMVANQANTSGLFDELDNIHRLSKSALDYSFEAGTHDSLEELHSEVQEVLSGVEESLEVLEKIRKVLNKADETLSEKLYSD